MLDILGERARSQNIAKCSMSIMRTFPQNIKHVNIVLRTFQSRIRNWKRAFRKFGKFEERSSKFLEIRKLEVISNECTQCVWNNISGGDTATV